MYSVYQHWDPLKVCIVGRSYPPEFYAWIKIPHVRNLFEKIAAETEEDFQAIIKKLNEFGVQTVRPDLPDTVNMVNGRYPKPPMTPRDNTVMIGDQYYSQTEFNFENFYKDVKDVTWPDCASHEEFLELPQHIQNECIQLHQLYKFKDQPSSYSNINTLIKQQGNNIITDVRNTWCNGAMVARIGRDLYVGTDDYDQDILALKNKVNNMFVNTRNHVVNTGGHSDSTYCPVAPGLIISLYDVPTYADTFPGWEVVYLPGQSWTKVKPFMDLKKKNDGKWWIPGFEHDQDVVDVVETWLGHWTGYVEETVFDVNMLIIDPKNVMVFNYNKQVFDALDRYGITPHIVPFRHRYFWDGGIHCVTSDLHREGTMNDYFS